MAEHFYESCPAMRPGDNVIDLDALDWDSEDWDSYDCPVCRFANELESDARGRGVVRGIVLTLDTFEEISAARNMGMSKIDIFQKLVLEFDPDGIDIKNDSWTLPAEELKEHCDTNYLVGHWPPYCPTCQVGCVNVSTEGTEDIWHCYLRCGFEVRTGVSLRVIPFRPSAKSDE